MTAALPLKYCFAAIKMMRVDSDQHGTINMEKVWTILSHFEQTLGVVMSKKVPVDDEERDLSFPLLSLLKQLRNDPSSD